MTRTALPPDLISTMTMEDAMQLMRAVAYQTGYKEGYQKGFQDGTVGGSLVTLNELKPALSDGLRHGSPECGRAMSALRGQHSSSQDDQVESQEDDDIWMTFDSEDDED